MDFKTELKSYLKRKRMIPLELARAAGVSYVSVYQFLRDKQDLRLKTVEKLRAVMR